MKKFIASAFICAAISSQSYALDMQSSRTDGLAGNLLLSRPVASSLVNLPVAQLDTSCWMLESGYNRMFELSELDQIFVAAATRWRSLTLALGLSQFGEANRYQEQTIKGSIAYRYREYSVGTSLSGMIVDLGDRYGTLRAVGIGFSAAWYQDNASLAFSADDINSPALAELSLPIEPRYRLQAEWESKKTFSMLGRFQWEDEKKPQPALAQTIDLADKASFYWGVQFEPTVYGGGVEFDVGKLRISYASSVHPTLGFTHTISLSFGRFMPRNVTGGPF